jgi:hypothetical protein
MPATQLEQPEQLNAADRAYNGSRFSEVVEALFANPYQRVWGGGGEPPLPAGEVTFRSVVGGIFARPELFQKSSERALDSGADLRWGADRKGFRRLVHPNGVCLIGRWQIVEETGYSGSFSKGSTALLTFDNAVLSDNGDSVIHFNHPTWRQDRNDPATATRIGGRKVR